MLVHSTTVTAAPEEWSLAWDVVAHCLEAFLAACEAGPAVDMAALLPNGPAGTRRLALVELIKVDLERRIGGGEAARVEDYAARFPELLDGGVPGDLLAEEMHLRRRAGEAVAAGEYERRFPGRAGDVATLLKAAAGGSTSAAHAGRAVEWDDLPERVGEFELRILVGRGAFARVYKAWQAGMGRHVALKVSADRGSESRSLAQLDHPHVVRVFDQRLMPERGLLLLSMAYAAGGTLHDVVRRLREAGPGPHTGAVFVAAVDGVLRERGEEVPAESGLRRRLASESWPALVCWVGSCLADALAHAHARGVLHRDIKPANVLLSAEGSPRLADFNVGTCARLEGDGPASLFGGSLAYMAPEQAAAFARAGDAAAVDGRADVFALGVTLWELLTGERPFDDRVPAGDSLTGLLALAERRRAGVPAAALERLAGCPAGLRRALLKCLAGDPASRYADAGALARDLAVCRDADAARLLFPERPPLPDWLTTSPALTLALLMWPLGLLPNLAASAFNIPYNWLAIVEKTGPAGQAAFGDLLGWVNLTLYPACVVVYSLAAWPVLRAFADARAGVARTAAAWARARRWALRLGFWGAGVPVFGWVVGGVVFPLGMHLRLPGGLTPEAFLHFLLSLTLCGLIAAAYPFFGVNALVLRALYPTLLLAPVLDGGPCVPAAGVAEERRGLARLEWSLTPLLVLAGLVPLLAVVGAALAGAGGRAALAALGVFGVVGLSVAAPLAAHLRREVRALERVLTAGSDADRPLS